ncbi:MAG: pentapeptide repeat-containing protein [Gammaproteobacteria bacterium]|nr:pentapeptide repeat-containing protein [Gammaproteobacteria bacterium]
MRTEQVKIPGLEWFVRRGSVVRGPFSSAKIRHFLLEGKLSLEDQVSGDRKQWQPIGRVPEVVPLQMRPAGDGPVLEPDRKVVRRLERARALRSIVVAASVVIGLIVLVTLVSKTDSLPERDCDEAPAAGNVYEGCVLSGVDWEGVDLRDLHATNINLSGARLGTADLRAADLRYADLSGADLAYARLQRANLLGATLRNADLTNSDLSGADLSYVDLRGARIGGARFGDARLQGAIWIDGSRCDQGNCPR